MFSAEEIRNSPVFIRKENNNIKNKWLKTEREYSDLVTDYKWIKQQQAGYSPQNEHRGFILMLKIEKSGNRPNIINLIKHLKKSNKNLRLNSNQAVERYKKLILLQRFWKCRLKSNQKIEKQNKLKLQQFLKEILKQNKHRHLLKI
ncbi:MAG: hypothetical protein ACON35_05845 [Candidatus Marinamargulisbacteria bacterium]